MSSPSVQYNMREGEETSKSYKLGQNFHEVLIKYLSTSENGLNFVITINDAHYIFDDYFGAGINVGLLTSNDAPIEKDDFTFTSTKAYDQLGIDINDSAFKDFVHEAINVALNSTIAMNALMDEDGGSDE